MLDWDEHAPGLWEVVGETKLALDETDFGLPEHLILRLQQWTGDDAEGVRLASVLSVEIGEQVSYH
jgi:hypothetical protein